MLGWRTVCAVEINPYAAGVLVARQNEGVLPPFPIWDDIGTFDGRPWRGIVDVVSGGFPCQDITIAGKGTGIDGSRSGLWKEMARIIGEIRPGYIVVENSPMLVRRGLARVLSDIAKMGFNARWGIIGAHDVGAPHKRERIWIVANAIIQGLQEQPAESRIKEEVGNGMSARGCWWSIEPNVGRVANGMAFRVDRIKVLGNGQVPHCLVEAWRLLHERTD